MLAFNFLIVFFVLLIFGLVFCAFAAWRKSSDGFFWLSIVLLLMSWSVGRSVYQQAQEIDRQRIVHGEK